MTAVESKPNSPEVLRRTVSASRLNTWLTCRLKFWFRYVAGIKHPRTPALYVGHTVHGALKLWNKARWRKEPLPVDELRNQFNLLWHDDQQQDRIKWDDGEEPGEKQTAWSLVDLYLKQSPIPPNEQPEAVEVSLESDLSKRGLPRLIGIIDLVRSGGRIVDYKTVGQTPSDEKAVHSNEVQLTCYSVMYREATGKTEGGLELHHLVKTKTPKLVVTRQEPATEQQRTRLFKQLESYSEGLGRNDFIPSPGLQCSACNYFNECRKWG
jgi:CRISPR/Cas system-associated exonuclease Cas4 (RecB family)